MYFIVTAQDLCEEEEPLRRAAQDRESVFQKWAEDGMSSEVIDKITALMEERVCYRLVPTESEQWSRWGGAPSLSEGVELPEEQRFLCQIALAELPESPIRSQLPAEGYLYFFIHRKGRDKGHILYRQEAPEASFVRSDSPDVSSRTGHISLEVFSEWIYPEYESDAFDELDLPAEMGNVYMDWEEEVMGDSFTRFREGNRLLGGWTDKLRDEIRDLAKREQELTPLLTLDPFENHSIKRSALADIPFLTQPLSFFLKRDQLEKGFFAGVNCRYGKPR